MTNKSSKFSLKLQITILVGVIVACVAIVLTVLGIFNSRHSFVQSDLLQKALSSPAATITIPAIPTSDGIPAAATSAREIISTAQTGFSKNSIVIMLVILFLALIFTYFLVGRALVPLSSLSHSVANITNENLSQKIPNFSQSAELSQLTNSFNEMLSRLQTSFEQQKRFSASAAHELKTPLATIKTSLQVLNLDESPSLSEYKDNAFVVAQSVDRLIEIVNNLLLFSNSNSSMNDEINIPALIKDCANQLSAKIKQKEIAINMDLSDCKILGNYTLVRTAIYNLIDNATKYNRQHGKIEISAKMQDDIVITIADCGIGISPQNLGKICEPFFRADQSRSKEIEGSGLGLAISKSIITSHQGTLSLSSAPSGTIVVVKFPCNS